MNFSNSVINDSWPLAFKAGPSVDIDSFIACFEELLEKQSIKTFWIAFSGGLDSTVLLHLISTQIAPPINSLVNVIHINHGLSRHAQQWESHCKQFCESLNFSYHTVAVDARPKPGESPEGAARRARYCAFEHLIQHDDAVVTAHHQDDQIETFFLQLFRGAGPKGLAAMPLLKPLGAGYLFRPLLLCSRSQLENYAKENHLNWIEDESNFDIAFDRNYIRHQLMPIIKKRWPGSAITLKRVIEISAQTDGLLDELAAIDYEDIFIPDNQTLTITKLITLSSARQQNLIRYWIRQLDLPLPNQIKLKEIINSVIGASQDANPVVKWQGAEIRRYRDDLYAIPPLIPHDASQIIVWDLQDKREIELPNGLGKLKAIQCNKDDNRDTSDNGDNGGLHIPTNATITIRFRQGGEKCQLPNRDGHHDLKKLFQEWGVPTWQRDRIPLIYCDGQLAAVVGHAFCNQCLLSPHSNDSLIELRRFFILRDPVHRP